jgi:hypothetical protein
MVGGCAYLFIGSKRRHCVRSLWAGIAVGFAAVLGEIVDLHGDRGYLFCGVFVVDPDYLATTVGDCTWVERRGVYWVCAYVDLHVDCAVVCKCIYS